MGKTTFSGKIKNMTRDAAQSNLSLPDSGSGVRFMPHRGDETHEGLLLLAT